MKKFGINIGIGLLVCAVGIVGGNADYDSRSSYELFIYGGLWYAGIAAGVAVLTLVVRLFNKSKPYVDNALSDRERNRIYDELMRLKKLKDENILSQEEYEAKSRDLKMKL